MFFGKGWIQTVLIRFRVAYSILCDLRDVRLLIGLQDASRLGEKVWESYVDQGQDANRAFWVYGPKRRQISVILDSRMFSWVGAAD